MKLNARNATLGDLADLLQAQQAVKLDVVVPAGMIRSVNGDWVVQGTEATLSEDGVTATAGTYRPTEIADENVSEKLGVPLPYVRRMRAEAPDLYDANVNGWLHGFERIEDGVLEEARRGDGRSFLMRAFRSEDGGPGIARALLSDRYGMYDNLDILVAVLDGVRQAGVEVTVDGCDLSERRMRVRVACPQVSALAPVLLENYRSPFPGGWTVTRAREAAAREGKGYVPGKEPVVFAGFEFSNSETGLGAWSIVPRLVVQMCANGLKFNLDAIRSVHLGAKLDEGIVRWSADTDRKALTLITAKARDAVAAFVSPDFLAAKLAEVEAKASKALDNPASDVEVVTARLRIPEAQAKLVLDCFIRSGQATAGGVMQAVTAAAQLVDDADAAADLEGLGIQALELAAAL